jgi:hypothetical protein
MSLQDFALGARAGFRDRADEDDLAGRRVRQVLRITQDLRELFSGSSSILDIASGSGEAAGQSHMEFTVVEGWLHLLGEWRYQLGSRVPERRGTRVSAFLCS